MARRWLSDRDSALWVVLGLVLFAVVGYVLLSYLGSLAVALFVYYASRPLYRRLLEYTEHPDVAVTVTILVFAVPMLAVLGYASLVGVRELDQFLADYGLESYRSIVEPFVAVSELERSNQLLSVVTRPDQVLGSSTQQLLQGALGGVSTIAGAVVAVLTRLFLIFVFVFYLLRDDRKIAGWFRGSFNYDASVVGFLEDVDDDLQTVFFGNFATVVATALIATAVFYAFQLVSPVVSYPLLLGMLTGIATLIPVVGMKLIYFPYTGYLLVRAVTSADVPLWLPAAFFLVTLVVVDTVPDIFVRSYLSKGGINMGLILLSYVLGSLVFGWYGVFFGPIVLVAFVNFAHQVFPMIVEDLRVGPVD